MAGLIKILLVFLGGGIGSTFRFIISLALPTYLNRYYLWGTLSVNAIGSLLIGFLWAIFERDSGFDNWRIFLIIGILGGFTTFSSFSIDVINLFRDGHVKQAFIYIFATNTLAIVLAWVGYTLVRQ